jgi:hypothetical protein
MFRLSAYGRFWTMPTRWHRMSRYLLYLGERIQDGYLRCEYEA